MQWNGENINPHNIKNSIRTEMEEGGWSDDRSQNYKYDFIRELKKKDCNDLKSNVDNK